MPMTVCVRLPFTAIAVLVCIVHSNCNVQSFAVIHTVLICRNTEFCVFGKGNWSDIGFSACTVLARAGVICSIVDSYPVLGRNYKLLTIFNGNIIFLRGLCRKLSCANLCCWPLRTVFVHSYMQVYSFCKACSRCGKGNVCVTRQPCIHIENCSSVFICYRCIFCQPSKIRISYGSLKSNIRHIIAVGVLNTNRKAAFLSYLHRDNAFIIQNYFCRAGSND